MINGLNKSKGLGLGGAHFGLGYVLPAIPHIIGNSQGVGWGS